jgi:hypothetical protein
MDMRGPPSPEFKIPHRFIFTYKHNLFEKKTPTLLYENVQSTIRKYREAWGELDAPVWFLDDSDCRSAIYATQPKLLTYFDRELHGSWKADICRVAALYLTGGYYFDVDMETVNPWIPNSTVAFATVTDPRKARYFQSFVASEQKGRILGEALEEMLVFYKTRRPRVKALLGPDTLKWAVETLQPSERGEMVILEEVEVPSNQSESLLRRDALGCCCNFLVRQPAMNETLFYSRIVGAGKSCLERNSPEGQAYLEKERKQRVKDLEELRSKIEEIIHTIDGEVKGLAMPDKQSTTLDLEDTIQV